MTVTYRYRAARSDGTIETGSVEQADRATALAHLSSRGLLAFDVIAIPDQRSGARRMASADLAVGLCTLATLLESGLPIGRALAAFGEVAPPAWEVGVPKLRDRVRQGDSLATAMERADMGIPRLIAGVIHAGEGGSGLAAAVERAAELAESSATLRSAVRNALAYPALLAGIGATSIAVIVGIVLPRFATIIADVGGQTPRLARLVMSAGNGVRLAALPAAVALLIGIAWWRAWIINADAQVRWHATLLRLPIVAPLRLGAASSRVCAALGALLAGGVPVALATQHASRACGDAEIERRVMVARDQIVGGARLSAALVAVGAVTVTAGRLIRAGEDSGRLGAMLDRAAELDVDRLTTRLTTAVRLIEPVLIVVFAGIIALVCGALLQTVYSVRPT